MTRDTARKAAFTGKRPLAMTVALLWLVAACTTGGRSGTEGAGAAERSPAGEEATEGTRAAADLHDAEGNDVGTATFGQAEGGVKVALEVRGLRTGGHGVHIHEVGRCDPPTFESAGEHFNPHGAQHGALNPAGPHAGDLPNVFVDADRIGRWVETTDLFTLDTGAASILDADGSALVVHQSVDDLRTDPSGNSGDRVACGVITQVAP